MFVVTREPSTGDATTNKATKVNARKPDALVGVRSERERIANKLK
jgi:hypothetical protein